MYVGDCCLWCLVLFLGFLCMFCRGCVMSGFCVKFDIDVICDNFGVLGLSYVVEVLDVLLVEVV